jgi:hypothetical protein
MHPEAHTLSNPILTRHVWENKRTRGNVGVRCDVVAVAPGATRSTERMAFSHKLLLSPFVHTPSNKEEHFPKINRCYSAARH